MQLLSHLRIRHRLSLNSLMVIIFIILEAVVAIFGARNLSALTTKLYEGPVFGYSTVIQVELSVSKIKTNLYQAVASQKDDEISRLLSETDSELAKLGGYENGLLYGYGSLHPDEIPAIEKLVASFTDVSKAVEEISPLIVAKQSFRSLNAIAATFDPLAAEILNTSATIRATSDNDCKTAVADAEKQRSNIYLLVVIFSVAALAVIVVISKILSDSIVNPISSLESGVKKLSEGDLTAEFTYDGIDAVGRLSGSLNQTVSTLKMYISDISETLSSMADKDMTVRITQDYVGDFAPIKTSSERILSSLNSTLSLISSSVRHVQAGGNQSSATAQSLAQGTTEQAASIQELSATVSGISTQVKNNATATAFADTIVQEVAVELDRCNAKMRDMTTAMTEINAASASISKIIKSIEDIAFQTNILALNAAVEAARAGAAGKGFAVVADEVRNLASKSRESANDTTQLIENSIVAVENGMRIATETAESLQHIVEGAKRLTTVVDKIAVSTAEQTASVEQINIGVEQISRVVQTNAAAAEESAASSEELSAQARTLSSLVGEFRLH